MAETSNSETSPFTNPVYQLRRPFIAPSLSRSTETKPRPRPKTSGAPNVPSDDACEEINPHDVGTPDAWVPRDRRMVRLTGKHPFNAEAKLDDLFSQGFLTPSRLFFVRNHGAVPKIDSKTAEEWKVQIHGLCGKSISLSLEDLSKTFQVVTFPVTLVCAGNRRREQNVVQQSLGFGWGAAGVSTTLFTGVWLSDVLDFVRPTNMAKHVIFEGSDQLPSGPYGTSQLLSWARDPRRRMMLAWAMNGLPLEPDHGFPLRLVVPGQIGGRSVKWLRRIELSQNESQHHLHFHDNKVLPMPVGPSKAREEKSWWYDPRYIIRELNVNSAIACPRHDEVLDTEGNDDENYTVRGYAYAGGGRRISRVEISFNGGKVWELAHLVYFEDQFRDLAHFDPVYGHIDLTESDQCFCWCFWSLSVSLRTLSNSSSLAVRAMDEALALQPRDMYWNAMGMMNNWWFRVCIHKLGNGKLHFEHPTMAGTQTGGWMQRLKDEGQDPAQPEFSMSEYKSTVIVPSPPPATVAMTKPEVDRKITMEELAAHATAENPWFVVQGEVYDATEYLQEHPGGPQSIALVASEDATDDFMAIHSSDAKKKLAQFHIGSLVPSNLASTDNAANEVDYHGYFLHPKIWKTVSLISVETVSKNSKIFRFVLDAPDRQLGLPIGQHIWVRLKKRPGLNSAETTVVQRAYTPLSRQNDRGSIDILVKIYYPTSQFPVGGQMSTGFAEFSVGDVVELKGPIGHFIWLGGGRAQIHGTVRQISEVGMVCGGSGVTPILQVLRGIFEDVHDKSTVVRVLDINRDVDDILCRAELEELGEKHPSRLRIRYSLTSARIPEDWTYSVGRINVKMIDEYLPAPTPAGIVCVCGPLPMEKLVKDLLIGVGWDASSQIVIF